MRVVGLMSGTSLDGIDVAVADIDRRGTRLSIAGLRFAAAPLADSLRDAALACSPPATPTGAALAELDVAFGEAFAEAALRAVRKFGQRIDDIDLIGSHGQTALHAPADGITVQLGHPSVIASRTGVTCVGDFRVADVAAGGQGAPLVPFVDRELFASAREDRAALNIGGIANVTVLPRGGDPASIRAFDAGPGTMVVDALVRFATDGRERMDRDGAMASRGAVSDALVRGCLAHPFFARRPPRSAGREEFGDAFARELWDRGAAMGLSPADLVATATALTARSAAAAVPAGSARLIVSGGGARNPALMAMLARELAAQGKTCIVERSDAHGIDADAKEAVAFAILAFEAVHGRPNHLPACTGARRAFVLGTIAPGANFRALMGAVCAASEADAARAASDAGEAHADGPHARD